MAKDIVMIALFPTFVYRVAGIFSYFRLIPLQKGQYPVGVLLLFVGYGNRFNHGVAGALPGQQHAPGVLHLNGFDSLPESLLQKGQHPVGVLSFLEQGTGIEPAQKPCGSRTFSFRG